MSFVPPRDLVCIEDDIVMVIIKHKRDIELFTDREEVVDRIAHIIILKNKTVFDGLWQGSIVLAKAVESCGLVAEDAAHV
jgi:hypothetical protein